jgi:hypothetical protein
MHATPLGQGIAASDTLNAVDVGAADQGEFAAALIVLLEVLTRALVVAALVRAFDFETV